MDTRNSVGGVRRAGVKEKKKSLKAQQARQPHSGGGTQIDTQELGEGEGKSFDRKKRRNRARAWTRFFFSRGSKGRENKREILKLRVKKRQKDEWKKPLLGGKRGPRTTEILAVHKRSMGKRRGHGYKKSR